jgi:hypothetical protein
VSLIAPSVVFRYDFRLSNPIPMADSFSIAIWSGLS